MPSEYSTTGLQGDLLLLVTGERDATYGNMEAWTAVCFVSTATDNRTVIAQLNVLQEKIYTQPEKWGYFFQILTHEIIHALGLNPMLYGLFVDPNTGKQLGTQNVVRLEYFD